ncbi:MAG: hypothetical protein M1840_003254 [Geoglossum simile]|nr:MAG: hypothetical protein M1840_003254 [Geoglossum simile]
MDSQRGTGRVPLPPINELFTNYQRSKSKMFSCPKCLDHRAFSQEDELFSHVTQRHPEYFEKAKGDGRTAAIRAWLRQEMHRDEHSSRSALGSPFKPSTASPLDSRGQGGSRASRPQRAVSTGAVPPASRTGWCKVPGDTENLALDHGQDYSMVDPTAPVSPIRPRKRTAPSPSDLSNELHSPNRGRGAPRPGADGDTSLQSNPTCAKLWRNQPDPDPAWNIPLEEPPRVYDKYAHVFRSKKVPVRRISIRPREVFPPMQQKQPIPPQPVQPQAGGRPVLLRNPTQQGPKDSSSESYPEKNPEKNPKKNPGLVLQPETRPISQDQLVAEVKGIYAGLVMVEAKCVDVDNKQAKDAQEAEPGKQPKLNNEQWQALIALHRTLLHEHHDFFLASHHPSASPALRRLASKYAMPARMWRHGIHSFLELLRHRLPDSLEHMLSFIYLAYSMMALLLETVPTLEANWIECLGDLGRYRMAIEDDDIRDREVWTGVARIWYSKAADKSPTVGRLYHHLAILARPNVLQQLYYYTRSLSCVQPFPSARESIPVGTIRAGLMKPTIDNEELAALLLSAAESPTWRDYLDGLSRPEYHAIFKRVTQAYFLMNIPDRNPRESREDYMGRLEQVKDLVKVFVFVNLGCHANTLSIFAAHVVEGRHWPILPVHIYQGDGDAGNGSDATQADP